MIDTPGTPIESILLFHPNLVDQKMGVSINWIAKTASDRDQVPVSGLALGRLDHRLLSQEIPGTWSGSRSADGGDLQVDQRNFIEAEFALLEVSGREFGSTDRTLNADHEEADHQ
jgi:hypothetical protein